MRSRRLLWATVVLLSACDGALEPPATQWRVYRVDEGDSLGHIALQTGIGPTLLQSMNGLSGDLIHSGDGLLVPRTPKTEALPVWRRPAAPPEWKACRDVEFFPRVGDCVGNACATLSDEEIDEPFLELKLGETTWRTEYPFAFGVDGLHHARVDLDGDGKRESVVSVREGVGNGLALETWRHLVVSDTLGPLASFTTNDYGFSFVEQERGCAFLAVTADWRTTQLRGEGLYFMGQLHVVSKGRLVAVGPEVARRLTNRFDTERFATLEEEVQRRHPIDWFTSTGAFVWTDAPDVGVRCTEPQAFTVERELVFTLEHDGAFDLRGWQDPDEPPKKMYDALIDERTSARRLEGLVTLAPGAKPTARYCESTRDGAPWAELRFSEN
ncbi:MAG: LysM peptidoglycan-binding domain-containing protein [Archangium sp.]